MKSASLVSLVLLFGLTFAEEKEWYVQTSNFSTPNFHEFPELNEVSTAGLVVGWVLYGLVLVISAVITFYATWSRNTEYTKDLEVARKKLADLGINY